MFSAERRQISPSSSQLRLIPNQSSSRRTYNNSKRILPPASRQWNARRGHPKGPSASLRSRYGKALLSRLPPLRRTPKKPVIRRKLEKSNDRSDSLIKNTNAKIADQSAKKKTPTKDRNYTFHVFLSDALCRICDNLQGEWRAYCRELRCMRGSTDSSWRKYLIHSMMYQELEIFNGISSNTHTHKTHIAKTRDKIVLNSGITWYVACSVIHHSNKGAPDSEVTYSTWFLSIYSRTGKGSFTIFWMI